MKKLISVLLAVSMFLSVLTFSTGAEPSDPVLGKAASVSTTVGSFLTLKSGEKVFADRTYLFGDALPSYLVGKTFLQTNIGSTVSVTVETDGFLYVLTQKAGDNDSQEATLKEKGFSKIASFGSGILWSAHSHEVSVMAKEVKKGDELTYKKWGILLADFTIKNVASVSSSNGNFLTVQKGGTIFNNRTYQFGNIPACLENQKYLQTGMTSDVLVTAVTSGNVYVLTQVDGTSNSQEVSLVEDGFTKIATLGSGILWSAHKYKTAVMKKEVKAGDTVRYSYWGLLIANEGTESFVWDPFATVMPQIEKPGVIAVGNHLFADSNKHSFADSVPEFLLGKNYLAGSVDLGGTYTVTAAGTIYVLTPIAGKSTSQVQTLTEYGFETVASIDEKKVSSTVSEPLVLMAKKVEAGDVISFERWGIVIADTDENYPYQDGSMSLAAPDIILHPTEEQYSDGSRMWQGVPGITKDNESGRLWAVWYSGGEGEGAYNFALLYTSTDDGKTWTGPVLAIDHEYPVRVFDPNLWMDPDGRMWLIWSQSYFMKDGVFGTWMMYTDSPDSDQPTWSSPVRVANGVAINNPIVLSDGNWLLPTAIWANANNVADLEQETNSNAYISKDKGLTWEYLGSVQNYEGSRSCDENMIIEQTNGTLRMLIRTGLGIEESYSYDGGRTWTASSDADISNVVSRFHITRLSSGNQLLIFNDPPSDGTGRSHMTAALSTDDGKTWSAKLVIDERSGTSYPDAVEDADGNIYIIYDCTRTKHGSIMMAKITEQDILAGQLVTPTSRIKILVNDNRIPGDIHADDFVDMTDLALMIRELAGWDTVPVKSYFDLNKDGRINNRDAIALIRTVAK